MDEILNSRSLNGVRFRMAKPQGYYTEDVEDFIDNQVRNSIATYEVKISDQEKEITTLNNKIDTLTSMVSELEIKANFNDASGSAEQDAALVASLERTESLEKQVATLQADLAEKEEFIKQLNAYIDEVQPYIEAGATAAALVTDVAEIPDAEMPEAPEDEEIEEEQEEAETEPEEEDEDDIEVDAEELRAALEAEDSDDDVSHVDDELEDEDDELEVDPEALRQAMEEDKPKKSYINNAQDSVEESNDKIEEPEASTETKIVDTFFEMDDDLEVDEEALRKALEEADGDDEVTTNYR